MSEKTRKIFRITAFCLLILLVITIPVVTAIRKISYDNYIELLMEYGSDSEIVQNYDLFSIPSGIYSYNCFLCVVSIIVFVAFLVVSFVNRKKDRTKFSFKEWLKKYWPLVLLAIFMAWTSVGCIQAGMEMDAEIYIKQAALSSGDVQVPERIKEIANWSPTDRMANTTDIYQNAKDRAWHGCENLKDGYFSFMFYAAVFLNILLLGINAKNYKKWIIRSLLITSFIMIILNYLAFFMPDSFLNVIFFNRLVFNNSNHYGYYISVILIMSVALAMTEKNLYFKVISIANCLLYFPMLVINDTFGVYLGILFAMIFLFIVSLIRLVSRKKIAEFVIMLCMLGAFIVSSFVIASATSESYKASSTYFTYTTVNLNIGDKSYRYYTNSISEDLAEQFGISKYKLDGNQVKWGSGIEELDEKVSSNIYNDFATTFKDIGVLSDFFNEDEDKITYKEDLTAKMQEITAKYPKVSGETFGEYAARQDKIQAELDELYKKNNLINESGELKDLPSLDSVGNAKAGLTWKVWGTGNGRGKTWIRCLDLVNQRPMFGWGLENLLNEFYFQYGISEGRTHNIILQLAGTVGIPGMIMYLVAVIAIFLKVMYDVKLRKYDKKRAIIIVAAFVIVTIIVNIILSKLTDKLLINALVTVITWALMYVVIFFKNVRLRVKDWNEFEYIGSAVFVSYMISSLFGNSAFYTSPYFMIFLGILAAEMIYKKSRFEEEEEEKAKLEESKKEPKTENKKVNKKLKKA